MWPQYQHSIWAPPSKPFVIRYVAEETALKMVNDPTVFAFAAGTPVGVPRKEASLRVPGLPEGRKEFLEMSGQTVKSRARGGASEYSVWEKRNGKFDDEWGGGGVFAKREPKLHLVVQMSDNLSAVGYVHVELSEDDFRKGPAGWEVQVLVDVDKSGVPSHVLIEKSSGNTDIDSIVCQKILLGRTDKREVRGGRIKVSYGFE